MQYIADFHVHSHNSIATSRECDPEHLFESAAMKGLELIGTGDFTHPAWRRELREKLAPEEGTGFFRLRPELEKPVRSSLPGGVSGAEVRFVLSGEISSIYKKDGQVRKVHHLILMPDLDSVDRFSERLEAIGNIRSDGRPILGLDSRNLLEISLESCESVCFIPAHIWTPHFSVFGSRSGFDRIEDCYGDLTGHIFAVETGLSSDPPMNWRLSVLDRYALVSNSDAHSPAKLAREANLFDTALTYWAMTGALKARDGKRFLGTLEFFPEEGKYHYDGHRACDARMSPEETAAAGGRCPGCGRKVTGGVLGRVAELADRPDGARPDAARHFEHIIPLREVIAEVLETSPGTTGVSKRYLSLLNALGPELYILRQAPLEEVSRVSDPVTAEALRRVRRGEVHIEPGYDGEYGTVKIFEPGERQSTEGQLFFFGEPEKKPIKKKKTAPPGPKAGKSGKLRLTPEHGSAAGTATGSPLDGLNELQLRAVTAERGPVVVTAGPGTGKTRCLTARAAHLILSRNVDPDRILAVTFTNKAAREMARRLAAMLALPDLSEKLFTGTFHRFCLELVSKVRGRRPLVLDGQERLEVLAGVTGQKGALLKSMDEQIGLAKSRGLTPKNFRGPEKARQLYLLYQQALAALGASDFDDLLLDALAMLRGDRALLEKMQEHYCHLLVDEFQDVNPVQYELVRELAGEGGGLFVIGDPAQSIYSFRGADPGVFERLKTDFPGACTVTLEEGYRCREAIAQAAETVLARSGGKAGFPGLRSLRPGGSLPTLIRCPSPRAEAIAVVKLISRLVGGTGMLAAHGEFDRKGTVRRDDEGSYTFGDFAVLVRTGAQCEELEECFAVEGIPCRVRGARSFLRDPLVRSILALLRLITGAEDDLRAAAAFRLQEFNPGAGYLEELAQRAGREGRQMLSQLKVNLSREVPFTRAGERAGRLLLALEKHRPEGQRLQVAKLAERLIEQYVPDPGSHQGALEALVRTAESFENLEAFCNLVAFQPEGDFDRTGRGSRAAAESVSIMTMHAAKGLEFPVVFICGAEDGLIPYTHRTSDLEEERRLLYVAMTRAAERLLITSSSCRSLMGETVASPWSRFLEGVSAELLEHESAGLPARKQQGRQLDLL